MFLHLFIYFIFPFCNLKFSKIIIIKIIELISSELHNFGTSKIIFHGSYFCRRENYFPLFSLFCHLSQSEVKFLRNESRVRCGERQMKNT